MIAWLQSILPFIEHAGGGGALIVGLLAAAYFSPVFKKEFVYAALVVAVALFIYGVGVRDANNACRVREAAVTTKVDKAVSDAKTSTKKDPFDDPRN